VDTGLLYFKPYFVQGGKPMACQGCSLKGTKKAQLDDTICFVIECPSCNGAPLGFLKRHTEKPTREERDHLFRALRQVATKKYGRDEFFIDEGQHEYEGHYHAHARKL
jgi:hypothetical protein